MSHPREHFKALLRAARAGSKEALGELLVWYWPLLKKLAGKFLDRSLRSKMEVAELVQETYVKALAGFLDFTGDSEGEWVVWLEQILIHQARNINKRFLLTSKRDVGLETLLSEDIAEHLQAHEFEEETRTREERLKLLWRSCGLLSPRDQLVLLLRYMDGMPFREVAALMDRSVPAVRKLCQRALGHLRQRADAATKRNRPKPNQGGGSTWDPYVN